VKQAVPSEKQGVRLAVAFAIYIKKHLNAKRRIMETQIFHHAKYIIVIKTSKRNQNLSRFITNLNTSKNIIFQKS
jgi:hypothetical protein